MNNLLDYIIATMIEKGFFKGGIRLFKDFFYQTRLPHFFLYVGVTGYAWMIITHQFPNPLTFLYCLFSPLFGGSWSLFLAPEYIEITKIGFACISNGLLFTTILMFNDYCDFELDIRGAKKRTLLTQGILTRRDLLHIIYTFMVIIGIISTLLGHIFFGLTLFGFFGLWSYSAPPIRAKTRGGLDLFYNGLHPWVIAISGAVVAGAPLNQIPYFHFLIFSFFGMIFFIFGNLMDINDDRRLGVKSLCAKLGFNRSISFFCGLLGGLIVFLAINSFFGEFYTLKWFLLALPFWGIGIWLLLYGAFKHLFNFKEKKSYPDHYHYKKFYKYLGAGLSFTLTPFIAFAVDYSIVPYLYSLF